MPEQSLHLRSAVRALVIDPSDRVLMIDLLHEVNDWRGWILPGGGLEDGEDPHAGLRRELLEEVGLADAFVGPLIATHRKVSPDIAPGFDGQQEQIFLVPCHAFEPSAAMTPEELRAEGVVGHRWFTVDELRSTDRTIAPPGLTDLIERVLEFGGTVEPLMIDSTEA